MVFENNLVKFRSLMGLIELNWKRSQYSASISIHIGSSYRRDYYLDWISLFGTRALKARSCGSVFVSLYFSIFLARKQCKKIPRERALKRVTFNSLYFAGSFGARGYPVLLGSFHADTVAAVPVPGAEWTGRF